MKLQSQLHLAREIADIGERTGMDDRPRSRREWAGFGIVLTVILSVGCWAQSSLPFDVSNPKHQKLPADEAGRIYTSACALAARTIRPERPPHLMPRFTLVLGAGDDEMVREEGRSEIHLKAWNPVSFAQAVVMLAAREILKNEDVQDIVRTAVLSAQASVSVKDIQLGR